MARHVPQKTNENNASLEIQSDSHYIKLKDMDCSLLLNNLLGRLYDHESIRVEDLKFVANCELPAKVTIDTICESGLYLVDYLIYCDCKLKGYDVSIMINKDVRNTIPEEQIEVLAYVIFVMLTRSKLILNDTEEMPRFLKNQFRCFSNKTEIERKISTNNIKTFGINWLKSVDITIFGEAFCNRVRNGIAGSRYFNIFKDYQFKQNIENNILRIAGIIKDIAMEGPYFEMHPAFSSPILTSMSISKNLSNLILDAYDDDEIDLMVKNKSLFSRPLRDDRYKNYLTWDLSLKTYYVTKLF